MPIVIGNGTAIGWGAVDEDSPIEFSFLMWALPDGYLIIDTTTQGRILLH